MKWYAIFVILGFLLMAGSYYAISNPQLFVPVELLITPTPVRPTPQISGIKEQTIYRAAFIVNINKINRDFNAPMYFDQADDVYMEEGKPNIVIVKEAGITWGDFFDTLPMKLDYECITTGTGSRYCTREDSILKFYVNGKRVSDFLDREIQDGDKALISYGNETDVQIQLQLRQIPDPRDPEVTPTE